ncbi:flavodoxin [Thermoanaerobacter italicus]|jgi:flavodoxin|nr:flavodoxin [Thermoanaerobacter italicus]
MLGNFIIGLGGGSILDTAKALPQWRPMKGTVWNHIHSGYGKWKVTQNLLPLWSNRCYNGYWHRKECLDCGLKEGMNMAKQILIVYFTWSGNTRKIANLIHKEIGGTTFEIQPKVPYPSSYNEVVAQAKKEIQTEYKPPLKTKIDHIESYDIIFVGSPNWWSTIAPPIATFLSEYDLSGKTIAPFCTHGGGGKGQMISDIIKLCPKSTILEEFVIYGSGAGDAQANVSQWLHKIGITQLKR